MYKYINVYATGVSFNYHMFGDDVGTAVLQGGVSGDGTEPDTYPMYDDWFDEATFTTLWSKSGNRGDSWMSASVNISSDYDFLRFYYTGGDGYHGHMALDDIQLVITCLTQAPTVTPSTTPPKNPTTKADTLGLAVGLSVALGVLLLLASVVFALHANSRKRETAAGTQPGEVEMGEPEYPVLPAATQVRVELEKPHVPNTRAHLCIGQHAGQKRPG